jgi:opacity protein-like surface antigen
MKLAMIAGLSALAMASGASAQDWYGQLNAGMSVGGKADADLSYDDGTDVFTFSEDMDLESGWLVSGAIGRAAGPVRWDVEVLYSSNDLDDVTLTDGTTDVVIGGLSVSQAAGMANVYYDITTGSSWTPYVGAGVGYGVTRFKAEDADADDVDSGLAWQLKAGVAVAASETVSWDIGYRYLKLADYEVAEAEGGEEIKLAVDTNIHALTVGVRFGF